MKQISVFLADGFEEIEGLTVVDILRRAGVHVDTVSVMKSRTIRGAHQIEVQADYLFEEMNFEETEMLVLPGGMPGTLFLQEHEGLRTLLQTFDAQKRYIGAICAAPSILGELGLLKGRRACCYPNFEEKLLGADVDYDDVCMDGHIITSRGMGTAIPFALKLTSVLCGKEKARKIGESIVFF